MHHIDILGIVLLGFLLRLKSLKVLVSYLNILNLFLNIQGGVDKIEHILGEVVRILNQKSRVNQSRIVEIVDQLCTILIGLLLNY